jgi:hypothetical protein
MRTYWGVEVYLHAFLTVSGHLHALDALLPEKEPPGAHCIGGWMGPRAGMDAIVERKILSPYRDSNS